MKLIAEKWTFSMNMLQFRLYTIQTIKLASKRIIIQYNIHQVRTTLLYLSIRCCMLQIESNGRKISALSIIRMIQKQKEINELLQIVTYIQICLYNVKNKISERNTVHRM